MTSEGVEYGVVILQSLTQHHDYGYHSHQHDAHT